MPIMGFPSSDKPIQVEDEIVVVDSIREEDDPAYAPSSFGLTLNSIG